MSETELTVPGEVIYLSKIREFIKEKAIENNVESKIVGEVQLAVNEACTNIMEHSYKFEKGKDITIGVEVDDGSKFLVTILDHGEPFDPTLVKLPEKELFVANRRPSGYGIYLIRKMMDEVKYQVRPGLGNELRLIKYLH